jgi:hypothetical protein
VHAHHLAAPRLVAGDGGAEEDRLRQPLLPGFLDEVTIRTLALGASRLDMLLRRHNSDVSVNVLHRRGEAQLAVTL